MKNKIFFTFLFLLIPQIILGAVSHEANLGKANGNSGTASLGSIDITSGDFIICTVLAEANGTTISSATFAGTAMTQWGSYLDIDDASQSHSVWYQTEPSIASGQTASFSLSGSTSWQVGCQSYIGVDPDSPVGTVTSNGGALGTPISFNRTSDLDGTWMFASIQSGSPSVATTCNTGCTARQELTPSGTITSLMVDSNVSVSNSSTHTITIDWTGGAQKLGYIAGMIRPLSTGSTGISTSTEQIQAETYATILYVISIAVSIYFGIFLLKKLTK